MSAQASMAAPTCSSARATSRAPWPYAFAFTTAITRGCATDPVDKNDWIARRFDRIASRSTLATVGRITGEMVDGRWEMVKSVARANCHVRNICVVQAVFADATSAYFDAPSCLSSPQSPGMLRALPEACRSLGIYA